MKKFILLSVLFSVFYSKGMDPVHQLRKQLIPLYEAKEKILLFIYNPTAYSTKVEFVHRGKKVEKEIPSKSGLIELGPFKPIPTITIGNTNFDLLTLPVEPVKWPPNMVLPGHNLVLNLSAPYGPVGRWEMEAEWVKPQKREISEEVFLKKAVELKKTLEEGPGKLSIVNKSTWPLLVTYTALNKEIKKVLRNQGELFEPGFISDISKITIAPYGQVLGYFGRPYEVEMEKLKKEFKAQKKDLTLELDAGYTGWLPQENWGVWAADPKQFTVPTSNNPLDAFKETAKRRAAKQPIDARHILGLPDDYTEDAVLKAKRELNARWHPDKHQNKKLATEITQIINDAADKLLKKIQNPQLLTEIIYKKNNPNH